MSQTKAITNNTVRVLIAKSITNTRSKNKSDSQKSIKVILVPGLNNVDAGKWNTVKDSQFVKTHMECGDIEVERAKYNKRSKQEPVIDSSSDEPEIKQDE